MKVLMIEPGKAPYEAELDGSLKSMQEAVGGGIEGYYPYAEPVAIVCNDEGKINGLPLNRAIYNQDGEMIEIMAGTFFIAGLGEESFADLLRICSNNLNQYARRANEAGSIYAADVDDLRTRLDSLWDGMDKLLRGFANIS